MVAHQVVLLQRPPFSRQWRSVVVESDQFQGERKFAQSSHVRGSGGGESERESYNLYVTATH